MTAVLWLSDTHRPMTAVLWSFLYTQTNDCSLVDFLVHTDQWRSLVVFLIHTDQWLQSCGLSGTHRPMIAVLWTFLYTQTNDCSLVDSLIHTDQWLQSCGLSYTHRPMIAALWTFLYTQTNDCSLVDFLVHTDKWRSLVDFLVHTDQWLQSCGLSGTHRPMTAVLWTFWYTQTNDAVLWTFWYTQTSLCVQLKPRPRWDFFVSMGQLEHCLVPYVHSGIVLSPVYKHVRHDWRCLWSMSTCTLCTVG